MQSQLYCSSLSKVGLQQHRTLPYLRFTQQYQQTVKTGRRSTLLCAARRVFLYRLAVGTPSEGARLDVAVGADPVANSGIFFDGRVTAGTFGGAVQQMQFRIESRENGDQVTAAPSHGFQSSCKE
jgi:hypothetical protein